MTTKIVLGSRPYVPPPCLSLENETATGYGDALDCGYIYTNWALGVTVTGTTTNVKVTVQGGYSTASMLNFAGSTWSSAAKASGVGVLLSSIPARYVRATLVTCASTASVVNAWVGPAVV